MHPAWGSLSGRGDMFGDVCLGLRAARFAPGCHMADFQSSTPDRVRVGRVANGSRRAEAPASRDRRRVGCLAPRHPRPRLQRRIMKGLEIVTKITTPMALAALALCLLL